jgi:BirA family biotin operon repressor/biotin-[acetyl-CoA-carboxylase] ligase
MQETRKAVLSALDSGPISGPALADRLDISRAAVWKHVEALREEGFGIGSSNDGYTLDSIPEFGGGAVEFGLAAPFDVEFHESIASTNERARELAGEGESNVAVLADEQTGGRGRLDRSWSSPSGGVWLSLLLEPDIPPADAPAYTLAAAVATARAAREAGAEATIKWPNDVQIEGAKLAGILTEMEGEADRVSWLVVGIGVNANVDAEALPTDRQATSLREAVGYVDRRTLTQTIIEEFWDLTGDGQEAILDGWRELNATLGQRVRVTTPSQEIVGEAVDIVPPGTLLVDTDDGRIEVTAGDCEHLRPAE